MRPIDIDSSAASSAAMEMYDKDGDGALAGAELDAVPALKKYLSHYDKDGDSRITRDEMIARYDDWANQKQALFGLALYIRLDGQPLSGADVKLVPESYMGENVKPATGVTMENGFATLAHADEDLPKSTNGRPIPGIYAGTFKLEITHPSKNIPAKYNTATVLGEEVAYDIPNEDPIPINLTSK